MKSDSEIELDMDEKALGRNSRFSFAIEIQADAEENSYESGEDAGDLTRNGKGYEDQVGSLKNEKDQSLDNDAREQMVSFYAWPGENIPVVSPFQRERYEKVVKPPYPGVEHLHFWPFNHPNQIWDAYYHPNHPMSGMHWSSAEKRRLLENQYEAT